MKKVKGLYLHVESQRFTNQSFGQDAMTDLTTDLTTSHAASGRLAELRMRLKASRTKYTGWLTFQGCQPYYVPHNTVSKYQLHYLTNFCLQTSSLRIQVIDSALVLLFLCFNLTELIL